MSVHILVIGKTGQLAKALKKEIDASNFTATFIDRQQLDLTSSPETILNVLNNQAEYDAVILAAAYTAVDHAETNQDAAFAANGRAPGIIANFCKTKDIPLVHISTDYVFNGQASELYKISDPTDPINTYGRSKRDGEIAIQNSGCSHAILRTSWVFDRNSKNFLTTMLRLGETLETISVVDDQRGRPTYAGHLAQAALKVTQSLILKTQDCHGIFHVTNTGPVISWAEFAQTIFSAQNMKVKVKAISTAEYPTPAKRPAFSALDTSQFELLFNYALPGWQEGLAAALADPH